MERLCASTHTLGLDLETAPRPEFLPVLWPDFDRDSLVAAIDEFGRRERRFGGTGVRDV